ncbi:MAG TPA: hypothetical protein VG078_07535, partial [Acidimicrobiales bacterium]|nr:hypothetical protein [Acidimicrobiales bacterium]
LMEGRTTIMIAHRLSTIRSVDRILVLNDGELVEQGTHKSLVARHGLYRQLWQAQTRHRQRVQAARDAIGQVEPAQVAPVEGAPRPSRNGASRNGARNGASRKRSAIKAP